MAAADGERLARLETEIKWHRYLWPTAIVGLALYFGISLQNAKVDAVKSLKEDIQRDTLGQAREAAIQAAKEAQNARADSLQVLAEANQILAESRLGMRIAMKKGPHGVPSGTIPTLLTVKPSARGVAIVYVKRRMTEEAIGDTRAKLADIHSKTTKSDDGSGVVTILDLLEGISSTSHSFFVPFDGPGYKGSGISVPATIESDPFVFRATGEKDIGTLACVLKFEDPKLFDKSPTVVYDFDVLLIYNGPTPMVPQDLIEHTASSL